MRCALSTAKTTPERSLAYPTAFATMSLPPMPILDPPPSFPPFASTCNTAMYALLHITIAMRKPASCSSSCDYMVEMDRLYGYKARRG
jgi:hypothetical protein